MFLGHASRKASWAGSLVLLYVKLLLLFEVRGLYLISWMDSSLDAEDVLISGELCALLILLWLEKFAHSAYMKAGLNFFQQDAKLQMKNTQSKNKEGWATVPVIFLNYTEFGASEKQRQNNYDLFGIQNSRKAYTGMLLLLLKSFVERHSRQ